MELTPERPKIIITLDLVHTLLRRHEMHNSPLAIARIQRIEQEAARRVKRALKNHDVHFLDSKTLEEGFRTHLEKEKLPVISIDDIHIPTAVDRPNLFHLHLTRQYDVEAGTHGHGPRPHAPSFEDQLGYLSGRLKGKQVALVDTGIFGGETLRRSVRLLESNGIQVKRIYAGVVRRKGLERIHDLMPGIDVIHVLGDQGFCDDWMFEMRDLIFGGRVVKVKNQPAGTMHYCDVPEFLLPNPGRVTPENRKRTLAAINAEELTRIGKDLRGKLNSLTSHTGIQIRKLKGPIVVFGRQVPVHLLINHSRGKIW